MRLAGPTSTLVLLLTAAAPSHAEVDQALAYLAAEVRAWHQANKCFSCHNNGDGVRALYLAKRLGKTVAPTALEETAAWLQTPERWEKAGANPGISDKILASVQYAGALAERIPPNRKALVEAATILVRGQGADGSWRIDALGSPATYGTALATYVARKSIESADPKQFAVPIARANAWFAALKPTNVPEAAASVLAGGTGVDFLLDAQNSDGGWGPWKLAPSEAFDTAIAMIALEKVFKAAQAVSRGRAYLLRIQQTSGGWPETTRPAGGQSYAQHISTTAWAAIALLRTDAKRD